MKKSSYTVEELVNDSSFVDWARGETGGKEKEKWDQWVKQSENNRKVALQAQKKITDIRFTSSQLPDINHEWVKVRDDIKEKEGLVNFRQDKSKAHNEGGIRLRLLFKTAAVLLLGAFVGLAIYMYQEPEAEEEQVVVKTVQTDYGEKKTINLPDGSKITMAPGSRFSYMSNWLEQPVRQVKIRGEALFSITSQKTKSHPKFVVKTEDGSASVWGTRFTVDTNGKGTKVVLVEGEVRVQTIEREADKIQKILKPEEMAQFSKTEPNIEISEVNPAVYTSWTTNELYFDNTPLSVLVNRIERTYGMTVNVKDPQLLDVELSGSIDFRSLDGLIKGISKVLDVKIYKSGQTVIIQQNKNYK